MRRRRGYKSHASKRLGGSTRALRRPAPFPSYRNRGDKCAADDVSADVQNDARLDHPAGPRRRLSR